jgi:two-component system phosphate regulon response regulator PhoB
MVLVVDDREETRFVLTRLLRVQGYDAASVASGQEALDFVREKKPSLVILDYEMPGLDGLSVYRQMKSRPESRDIPVVMFSANDGQIRQEALAEGIKAWVMKGSLDLAELLREVAIHVGPPNPAQVPETPATPRTNRAG